MSEIANLRRARVRCHKQLKQTEALLVGYQAKLAEIEARIFAVAPEIDLPFRFHKPNPVFARGEMTRLVMDVLREADRPLLMREIAAAMLARKGVATLERRLIDHTISGSLARWLLCASAGASGWWGCGIGGGGWS